MNIAFPTVTNSSWEASLETLTFVFCFWWFVWFVVCAKVQELEEKLKSKTKQKEETDKKLQGDSEKKEAHERESRELQEEIHQLKKELKEYKVWFCF